MSASSQRPCSYIQVATWSSPDTDQRWLVISKEDAMPQTQRAQLGRYPSLPLAQGSLQCMEAHCSQPVVDQEICRQDVANIL